MHALVYKQASFHCLEIDIFKRDPSIHRAIYSTKFVFIRVLHFTIPGYTFKFIHILFRSTIFAVVVHKPTEQKYVPVPRARLGKRLFHLTNFLYLVSLICCLIFSSLMESNFLFSNSAANRSSCSICSSRIKRSL